MFVRPSSFSFHFITSSNTALVGITAALSIIFVGLAFKANSIWSWYKSKAYSIQSWYRAKFRPLKKSTKQKKSRRVKSLKVYNEPEDSDRETSGQEDPQLAKESDSESSISSKSNLESLVIMERYAPLFGRFTFHTNIPGARRLWKYEYHQKRDENGDYILSKEYPLHRYLIEATQWIGGYLKKPVPPDRSAAAFKRSKESRRRFTSLSRSYGIELAGATLSLGVSREHRRPLEDIVVVESDTSDAYTESSLGSSYLDDYSSDSSSDHNRETRTTKKRSPARLTSNVSKRVRATALVDPMLRFVRRRRRARRTDIEAGASSSLSESDVDF
jgi:hypothetical protein